MKTELFVSPVYDRQEQDVRIVDLNGIFYSAADPQTEKLVMLQPTYVGKLLKTADFGGKFLSGVLNATFSVELDASYANPSLRNTVIQPVFNHEQVTAAAALLAFKASLPNMPVQPVAAAAVNDGHWVTTTLPTQVGGYATEQDAAAAAAVYTNVLEVDTYQQPEGSFSFTIKRDTTLTCPIINTGLVATQWLLGGG